MSLNKISVIVLWICKIVAALIMLQTLYFKFTASEESVYIFTKIGMEPWGRIGIGIFELIASILLLTIKWDWMGALLGIGLMAGAIFFHLTVLGIDVMNDHGYLFSLAVAVVICSTYVVIYRRNDIISFLTSLKLINRA